MKASHERAARPDLLVGQVESEWLECKRAPYQVADERAKFELAKDVALRLLPVTRKDVSTMIDGLKLNRLLGGFRGQTPADRKALEATVSALAQFYLDHRARVAEIEINPLMVCTRGAIAVDVRVLWRRDGGDA